MHNSIVAFAVLVAVTGCGDDKSSSPESGNAPVALSGTVNEHGTEVASKPTIELELDDFYFSPTYVKGKPGAPLALTLKNEGAQNHTFTIDDPKVDVTVAADGTGSATLTVPASGAIRFYCRFHGSQGMQGAIFLKEGDTVAPGGASSSGDGGTAPYGG